jgi:DNA polymerase-4
MALLESVTPLVEQLSIDEAFLDVAGARRRLGLPEEIAAIIRARIRAETGLTASVGVASTKFLAKLGSDLAKPDGMLLVPPGTEHAFLAPLPVDKLWGVGPATRRKLDRMGMRTIGDVAALDEVVLVQALGNALGHHLYALARNDDERAVVPEREAKSIGAEETFGHDLHDRAACERELVRLADRAAQRLRSAGLAARTVTLKIRFADFETRTRARTRPEPFDLSTVVAEAGRELLAHFDVARGVRLLGLSLSQFAPAPATQIELDLDGGGAPSADERTERRAAVERAVDEVRDRFGTRAVRPATLVEPEPKEGR